MLIPISAPLKEVRYLNVAYLSVNGGSTDLSGENAGTTPDGLKGCAAMDHALSPTSLTRGILFRYGPTQNESLTLVIPN